uniref:Uncharacterized protein n=1 Tax=Anguilla anguilla TaxID=7936 RepID=A0A0E9U2U1_ANGAN
MFQGQICAIRQLRHYTVIKLQYFTFLHIRKAL